MLRERAAVDAEPDLPVDRERVQVARPSPSCAPARSPARRVRPRPAPMPLPRPLAGTSCDSMLMRVSSSLVSRRCRAACRCLRGVFLHHELADVRAQLAERARFVQRFRRADTRTGSSIDLADARRARAHDDDARGEVDRLLDRMRDQHHGLAFRCEHLRAAGPASRCASARRARRTARPSAGTAGEPRRRARAPGAGACRPRASSATRPRNRRVPSAPCSARRSTRARPSPARLARELQSERDVLARRSATERRRIPGRSRRGRGRGR